MFDVRLFRVVDAPFIAVGRVGGEVVCVVVVFRVVVRVAQLLFFFGVSSNLEVFIFDNKSKLGARLD